jgi:3-oxoacyl-[acyl-carrier-protein] synthase-3
MAGSAIPRLASEVSVSLEGVGSYLPDRRVPNEEILEYLHPGRPDGRPLEPEWVVRHLGIDERRLDYEFGGTRKRSRAEGGMFDGDLALRASRSALADAGLEAVDVDVLVHMTTTPDLIACQDHFRFLMTELGLRWDTDLAVQLGTPG